MGDLTTEELEELAHAASDAFQVHSQKPERWHEVVKAVIDRRRHQVAAELVTTTEHESLL